MLTIGAGFGLMSISVLIADCVMLHCTKDRKFFQQMKELDINENSIIEDGKENDDKEEEEENNENVVRL
jgi:hypothetical protein